MATNAIRMLSIDNQSLATNLDKAGYRKMGVQITSCDSFSECKKILESKQIDVLVINLDFKDVDGYAITKHLKESEQWSHLAVILTSVRNAASIKKKALQAGADLFVEQPVPRNFFIEKIKGILEQQIRDTERVTVEQIVEFVWENSSYTSEVNDLSASGMLIATSLQIENGTKLKLKFSVPGFKKDLHIVGEVARTIPVDKKFPEKLSGVGVKFVKFEGDSQRILEKYVETTVEKNSRMQYYL